MEEQDEGVREQDDVQDDGDEQGGQEEEEELEEETSIMEEGDQLDDSVREAAANQGLRASDDGDENEGSEADPQQDQSEAPPVEFKKGTKVEVEYEGDWWDAHIVEEGEDGTVRVHYVGGTEDEDEWVDPSGGRLRQAARAEVVWARVRDGPSAPAVLLQGSLRNPYCKKLQIFHFVDNAAYSVRREHVTAFTPDTIPKRNSDKRLAAAIELAKEVYTTGDMPEDLAAHQPALQQEAAEPGMYPPIARGSKGIKKSSVQTAQERRRQAMRKLGLLPPLGVEGDPHA